MTLQLGLRQRWLSPHQGREIGFLLLGSLIGSVPIRWFLDIPITVAATTWNVIVGTLLGLVLLRLVDSAAHWLVRRSSRCRS